MTYWKWLTGISFLFIVAERLWPRRRTQRMLRRGILTDIAYVIVNGHVLGFLLAELSRPVAKFFESALATGGMHFHTNLAQDWSWVLQVTIAFVTFDLFQWCIHNLLHRIPWLWEIHKVHHSVEELDWLASLRFHWVEIIIYRSLQYPLLALLGFDSSVLFVLAVVSTFIGHFNHSNLRVNLGPLKYLFNSPGMHEWHHVHADAGPTNKNLAINLALWDWMFGTAYLPPDEQPPGRLGFPGVERFPRPILLQELWPLSALARPSKAATMDGESRRI